MRPLSLLAALCAVAVLDACSVKRQAFTLPSEDCGTEGDEDENGLADCDDPACVAEPACAPTCDNGKQDGNETAVDCGGSCPPCGDRAACRVNRDCDSGLCGGEHCVRLASCKQILDLGFSTGDGSYSIDPDGAGGAPSFVVKCDMTVDLGGWTRFNWVTGAYPANQDPFEQALSQCAVADPVCRGRIPANAVPVDLMVRDLGDGDIALWKFDSANQISNAVLGALRDKAVSCQQNRVPWQPYRYSGTESFCGTGGEGGCDSFVYVNGTMAGCPSAYVGWYTELDGDTGCYNAAFKLGMTHTGFETIGCEMPDVNYLDDGPTSTDDNTGELYYR